jgi:hypothetical protein
MWCGLQHALTTKFMDFDVLTWNIPSLINQTIAFLA